MQYNRDHGREVDGATLRVASLQWIPSDGTTPQSLTVRVGMPIEAGGELFIAGGGAASVTLSGDAVAADRTLTVGPAVVPVPANSTTITEAGAVEAVRTALGKEQAASGVVALSEPRPVGVVAASAVVTDASGRTCFFSDLDGEPVLIEAAAGSIGTVDVPVEMVGDPVLINPRQLREDRSCG